jgi:outer membrane receptor protein involved in Fe transport
MFKRNARFALYTSSACIALASVPAHSQSAPETQTARPNSERVDTPEAPAGEIVVTGSLIQNPALQKATPVSVIGSEEINLRQSNVAEELLRILPGSVPGVGSNVSFGSRGASTVNLRGLGANRNVVLLDGSRIVPTDLNGFADLNNIPLALVDRVEVLTGGASTTYGADAVSGVVNFVTRRDFSGAELTVSRQVTERGDTGVTRVDSVLGANFKDGRGNAVLGLSYQKSDALFQDARDFAEYNISSTTGAQSGSTFTVPGAFSLPGLGTRQINPATGAFPTAAAPIGTARTLFNVNPYQLFQTPLERFNAFASARYEVSDALEFYTQALYSHNKVTLQLAPSGLQGETYAIPYSNPYLPAAARSQFCAANGLTSAQCTAAATATDPSDPNYRTFNTAAVRRFSEGGPRGTEITTDFFQWKGGLRGQITSGLRYDVNGTYGESTLTTLNDALPRYSLVQQALLATNTSTCLNNTNGCVPLNVFGADGSITQNMLDFINTTSQQRTKTTLGTAQAVISGDVGLASPFAADSISVAIGAEYRKYTAALDADALSLTSGEIIGQNAIVPVRGRYDVKELFGELIAPLVQDRPFFHSLTLETGLRWSDYSTSGSNFTWKAGGSWEPVAGLKLRGSYQSAARAPSISELFSPTTTSTGQLVLDPCQYALPVGNEKLTAICLAQGSPANQIGSITAPAAGSVNVTSGGNPNLGVEHAKTFTIGVLAQPRLLPGFSISVDYYNIRITDAITSPTVGDAIAACFGDQNPNLDVTPACTAIRRNPLTGALSGPVTNTAGLPLTLSNLGTILSDGIDVSASYRRDLGFARLLLNFDGNWTNRSRFQATPNSIVRECAGYYSTNCNAFGFSATTNGSLQPKFTWNQRTTLNFGKVDTSLLWRHIGKMQYEPAGTTAVLPEFASIKPYDYFDFTIRARPTDNLTLTLTVQNLFDRQPPIVGANAGPASFNAGNTYPSTYDVLGRRFAISAQVSF